MAADNKPRPEAIRDQMERILASDEFRASDSRRFDCRAGGNCQQGYRGNCRPVWFDTTQTVQGIPQKSAGRSESLFSPFVFNIWKLFTQ